MSKMRLAAVLVILVAAVIAAGCGPTEQQCEDMGFVKVDIDPSLFPTTPIIILEKRADTNLTKWMFKKDDKPNLEFVEQDDSGESMFTTNTVCHLRRNFIGASVAEFLYMDPNSHEWKEASRIVATKDNLSVSIALYGDILLWNVSDPDHEPKARSCPVFPTTEFTEGMVPEELIDLDYDTLGHGWDDANLDPVEKVKIRINLP
jgi:hypothetical protein